MKNISKSWQFKPLILKVQLVIVRDKTFQEKIAGSSHQYYKFFVSYFNYLQRQDEHMQYHFCGQVFFK